MTETHTRQSPSTLDRSTTIKWKVPLALILSVLTACDEAPTLINELVEDPPGSVTKEWLQDVFLRENPNATEYRLVEVNSRQILNDADRIRLTLLDGDIVTAIRRSSEAYDGSIRWAGAIDGVPDSDVQVLATQNPYLKGHVVMGERVELFSHAVPGVDSIIYKVDTPDRTYSRNADILPDADPSNIEGVAWRALVDRLPASSYRVVTFNVDMWRKKSDDLEQVGWAEMRFFDDAQYRVVASERGGRPIIEGDEMSSVSLRYFGGNAGLTGSVRSRKTGAVRVTPIDKTGFYILWKIHPDFRKKID